VQACCRKVTRKAWREEGGLCIRWGERRALPLNLQTGETSGYKCSVFTHAAITLPVIYVIDCQQSGKWKWKRNRRVRASIDRLQLLTLNNRMFQKLSIVQPCHWYDNIKLTTAIVSRKQAAAVFGNQLSCQFNMGHAFGPARACIAGSPFSRLYRQYRL
jgi:hypothetical protein